MRRTSIFVSAFAAVPLGLMALGRPGPTAAQDATPMADGGGFAGSWRVTVSSPQGSPGLSLGTFGADGTLVTHTQPVLQSPGGPGGVIFPSAGHGAWEATGPDTAILTFVSLVADGQGNLFGITTVRASVTLGADGETFSGEGVRVITDPGGNTVATTPLTVQAARIVAEAPATPAA